MAMKQTTKSLVTVLAFLAVAGVAALGALYVNKDEAKKAAATEESAKFFAIDKAKARDLKLVRDGALVAEVKRASATAPWTLALPAQVAGAEADEATVSAILDRLDSLRSKNTLDGMDAKAAGLDTPKLAVTVGEEGGKESTLLLGADNTFNQTTYAQKKGEAAIQAIATADKAPFEKTVFDLRDKRVAHLDPGAEVRKIEVSGTQAPYTLEKDGADWKLAGAAGGKADAAAAANIARAVSELKATGIAAETADAARLAGLGLAPAKITARLTLATPGGKDALRTVLLGQPAQAQGSIKVTTVAKRDDSPTVFEVDSQIIRDLDKPLFDLQDKSVLAFDREQVRRIEVAAPGAQTISVARSKGPPPDGGVAEETFEVLAPTKGPANKWKMSGLLFALSGMKAAAMAVAVPATAKGKAALGLDKPRTVTLFGEGDKVLARIFIGGEATVGVDANKRRYVQVEGSPRAIPVEKGQLSQLPTAVSDVLQLDVKPTTH